MSNLATADASASTQQVDHHMSGWSFIYRSAERFGLPTLLVGVLLWWARTDLVKPLLDAHYEFLSEIRKQGDDHTTRLDELIGLLRSQNFMLREEAYGQKGRAGEPPAG